MMGMKVLMTMNEGWDGRTFQNVGKDDVASSTLSHPVAASPEAEEGGPRWKTPPFIPSYPCPPPLLLPPPLV